MTVAIPSIALIEGERVTIVEPSRPEPPRKLFRPVPPAETFPVVALGPELAAAANAIIDMTQAAPAICANSVLAVASLAVQAQWDVRLPTGQSRPTSLFIVTVAGSGERKTSADQEALRGVREREQELRLRHQEERQQHKNANDAYEAGRAKVIRENKGDVAATRLALDALGQPPRAPENPILVLAEPTIEGLIKLLSTSQASVGLFSSEGGAFIGGHAMTDEAKLRSAARLSSLWDGTPVDRVRSSGEAFFLVGRRVAMHLMAQPHAASRFLADPLLRDQGLLSRILIAAPDATAGNRPFRDPALGSRRVVRQFADRALDHLRRKAVPQSDGADLPALSLDADARDLFVRWHDEVERALATKFTAIRGFAAKLPEHAARIAAVIAAFGNTATGVVSGSHMASGIRLADYYAGEAIRLSEGAKVSAPLISAEQLRLWLYRRGTPHVHLAEVYQSGPTEFRDRASAASAMDVLEEHGWVTRIKGGMEVEGRHRRDAWQIVSEE